MKIKQTGGNKEPSVIFFELKDFQIGRLMDSLKLLTLQ
jgi:hypothetical protein